MGMKYKIGFSRSKLLLNKKIKALRSELSCFYYLLYGYFINHTAIPQHQAILFLFRLSRSKAGKVYKAYYCFLYMFPFLGFLLLPPAIPAETLMLIPSQNSYCFILRKISCTIASHVSAHLSVTSANSSPPYLQRKVPAGAKLLRIWAISFRILSPTACPNSLSTYPKLLISKNMMDISLPCSRSLWALQ